MITPTDPSYLLTKELLLNKKSMHPIFQSLAQWIHHTYGVQPINILYDTIDHGTRSRLEIILEYPDDRALFINPLTNVFDTQKQQAIAHTFRELLSHPNQSAAYESRGAEDFPVSRDQVTQQIWVIFSDFSSVARIDANESIPQEEIQSLKERLNNDAIWEISRSFAGTTFFLYTESQVKAYRHSDTFLFWTDQYFRLLTQYDPFNYFKKDTFSLYLDSKENFENNHGGNWYYYYK
jgi:hypothetical protein